MMDKFMIGLEIFSCIAFYVILVIGIIELIINGTMWSLFCWCITTPIGWVGELHSMPRRNS